MTIETLWFQKNLMALAIAKTEYLVFYRWTITWAPALDISSK